MRAHLAALAVLTALAGCTATAAGTVTPGASASPKASTSPAAPGASATPAVSASADASFQAQKTFDTTTFSAKIDGKAAPMSTTADRIVLMGVADTVALTLGKVPTFLAEGQYQVVISIAGKGGKHAAMPTFTTADMQNFGWQFFEGTGKPQPKGYVKSGTAGTETVTFAGGKLNATIKTEVKNPIDFTGKEPVRQLELTITDLPM